MSGKNSILLDTNIVIDIFKGDEKLAKRVNEFQKIYITPIVLGELYIGINRVDNRQEHIEKLHSFLQWCGMLELNEETAKNFGEIVAQLYKKGKPIPTNDVWIAASAIENNVHLMTKDKHFKEVDNLILEDC